MSAVALRGSPAALPSSDRPSRRSIRPDERGQATAEYALVLLGAAAIALLVVAWATKTGVVGELFDAVLRSIVGKAGAR